MNRWKVFEKIFEYKREKGKGKDHELKNKENKKTRKTMNEKKKRINDKRVTETIMNKRIGKWK